MQWIQPFAWSESELLASCVRPLGAGFGRRFWGRARLGRLFGQESFSVISLLETSWEISQDEDLLAVSKPPFLRVTPVHRQDSNICKLSSWITFTRSICIDINFNNLACVWQLNSARKISGSWVSHWPTRRGDQMRCQSWYLDPFGYEKSWTRLRQLQCLSTICDVSHLTNYQMNCPSY